MPLFIRCTQETTTAAGKKVEFVYINVAHVVFARYNETDKTLAVTVQIPDGMTRGSFTLSGAEAQTALAVLQDVSK